MKTVNTTVKQNTEIHRLQFEEQLNKELLKFFYHNNLVVNLEQSFNSAGASSLFHKLAACNINEGCFILGIFRYCLFMSSMNKKIRYYFDIVTQ